MTEADWLQIVRRCLPSVTEIEVRHGTDRVRRMALGGPDGRWRPAVLRRAPRRELDLYSYALSDPQSGAPALLGAAETGEPDAVWLLLDGLDEHYPDFSAPADVAAAYRHLGALHRHFAGRPLPASASTGSPWIIDAAAVARDCNAFPQLAPHASEAARRLTDSPATLVQGDYHRWNLLLDTGRIRVLDWEHAALAHPVWDLVLTAPDEPGWDGVPRGALAELALRTYHAEGLLASLPWADFLRLHTLARLFVAARRALVHQAKAAAMAPGAPREQVLAYARLELDRIASLSARV